jgi:hypothetical protein
MVFKKTSISSHMSLIFLECFAKSSYCPSFLYRTSLARRFADNLFSFADIPDFSDL